MGQSMLSHLAPLVSQDLSVAGRRAGLKHEGKGDDETTRSGLFMEAVRIIKEMREATNGLYPAFAVWENVPGAFSSNKGEDFRTVLEELIRIVEPTAVMPSVPKAGWAYADVYCGDGWSLAYRVLDAQFWGVPQRRRRIYLVLDLRGERAGGILFKRGCLSRHTQESGTPWKATAGNVEDCAGATDRKKYVKFYQPKSLRDENWAESNVKNAIRAEESRSGHCVVERPPYTFQPIISAGFCPELSAKARGVGYENEKAPTLRAGAKPCVVVYDARGNGDGKTVNTLTGDHNNRITDYTSVICLQGNGIDRADTAGCNGKGWKEDVCYTLNTIDRPAVSYAECYQKSTGPLMANSHPGSYTGQDAYSDMLVVGKECAGVDCRNFTEHSELYPTLQAKPNGGQSLNYSGAVRIQYIVRRLTPTECARLQGFPDQWGHPDHKDNFADDEYAFWLNVRNTHATINGKAVKDYTKDQMLTWYNKLHTDSAEYKLWGNGIALPCALYVMEGIAKCLSTEK